VGKLGIWWTASERGDTAAYQFNVGYHSDTKHHDDLMEYFENIADIGLSVRCVQNAKK